MSQWGCGLATNCKLIKLVVALRPSFKITCVCE